MVHRRFPNMFMILGPNGPFTNLPPTDPGSGGIHHRHHPKVALATETGRIDVKPDAESDWT